MSTAMRTFWLTLAAVPFTPVGLCQDNPYVYVKMPLTVPWTLYFVFLGAVLIPYVVMIALAWRKHTPAERDRAATPQRNGSEAES